MPATLALAPLNAKPSLKIAGPSIRQDAVSRRKGSPKKGGLRDFAMPDSRFGQNAPIYKGFLRQRTEKKKLATNTTFSGDRLCLCL
jgi:hypothetical protein